MKGLSAPRRRNSKGFTTVYLLMILGTLVTAVVMIINAACGFAARSIVNNVCALAGRSVLSEFQKNLYERYGVFAVRGDDALLSRLSEFYISGSLVSLKALVNPVPAKVNACSEAHPALDVSEFGKQVRRLAPGAALTKGKILEYLLQQAGVSGIPGIGQQEGDPSAPSDDYGSDDAYKDAEKSFGKDGDSKKGQSIKSSVHKSLPSKLLGYPKRISLVLSGGITDLSFAAVAEDEYMLAVCSNVLKKKDGGYLDCELEYILYGNASDQANRKALKMSLFALRFAVNEAKNVSETGEIIASTALSAAQSLTEVKTLLAGGKVDKIGLEMYLRLLLALLPRNEKLARLMDVMELNIRFVDGANFSFRNYAYGFELEAEFALKKRSGDVSQTFVYH